MTYNVLVTIFFIYLVLRGESVGVLLWPILILHAVFATLLSGLLVKQAGADV